MAPAVVLVLTLLVSPLPLAERVVGARAVERARYTFVIGATKPFDEVYPPSIFEKKAAREMVEEDVLARVFGMVVTPELLAAEYDRIERETRAPDQWGAVKRALGGDRRRIEEVVCRPLLVNRALRARFAFNSRIHEKEREQARHARNRFLAGKVPSAARRLRLARTGEHIPTTDDLLLKAQVAATGPTRLKSERTSRSQDSPIAVDPEMANVLERELQKPGNVTTILEERDRFSVFRLRTATPSEWLVDGVVLPKRGFDAWLESELKSNSETKKP
jgi:hypothetical protein